MLTDKQLFEIKKLVMDSIAEKVPDLTDRIHVATYVASALLAFLVTNQDDKAKRDEFYKDFIDYVEANVLEVNKLFNKIKATVELINKEVTHATTH